MVWDYEGLAGERNEEDCVKLLTMTFFPSFFFHCHCITSRDTHKVGKSLYCSLDTLV